MSARDVIAATLCLSIPENDSRQMCDIILSALTAAGYRIIPPGGLDRETMDVAATIRSLASEDRT